MRLSPRSMRVLALVSVSFVAAVAACSSSSTEDVLIPDAGPDTGTSGSDSGSGIDTGTTVGFDSGTGSETSTTFDSGPQYDAGAPTTLDGGDSDGGGIPCVLGGVGEHEPNDSAGEANSFQGSICGVIDPTTASDAGDGGVDTDFVTFTLKSTTQSFYVQFAGDVTLIITVDGQTVTMTPTSFPSIPFVKGKPYIVQVKANTANKTYWRVSVFET